MRDIAAKWKSFDRPAGWLSLLVIAPLGSVLVMAGYAAAHLLVQGWWWNPWRVLSEMLVVAGVQTALTLPLLFWLARGRPRLTVMAGVYGVSAVLVFLFGVSRLALLASLGVFFLPVVLTVAVSGLKPIAREHERFRCRRCGYDLFGTRGGHCPECGRMLSVRQRRMFRGLADAETLGAVQIDSSEG